MSNPFWFRCDWINPFRASEYNWIDFSLIEISGEYDGRFGNLEFHVALAGFHFGGRWKVADGDLELQADLKRMVDEIASAPPNSGADVPDTGMEHAP